MQAISAWRDNSGFGRAQLVKQYFLSVEGGMQHPSIDYQALSGPLACTKREMTERLPPTADGMHEATYHSISKGGPCAGFTGPRLQQQKHC